MKTENLNASDLTPEPALFGVDDMTDAEREAQPGAAEDYAQFCADKAANAVSNNSHDFDYLFIA